jgi:branched-chain amino acid aminotransferase
MSKLFFKMYYNEQTQVFLDGEFLNPNSIANTVYTQTMHYGNGVFEGIRSYNTEDGIRIFKANEHFDRLRYSANVMQIPFNYSNAALAQLTHQLLEKNGLKDAYIRPLVYMGDNMSLHTNTDPHLLILAWEWGKYLGSNLLKVMTSSYERPNPKSIHIDAKVVGHYTNSILATNEAKSKGFDEALLTDASGFVAEGPGANFFYEKNGELYTAPLGNILPGITRATVIELAKELAIPVNEQLFKPEEIYTADTAFFCGTAAEVAGIGQFNDHVFKANWEDTLSALIQKKYQRRVAHNEYQHVYL